MTTKSKKNPSQPPHQRHQDLISECNSFFDLSLQQYSGDDVSVLLDPTIVGREGGT